MKPEKEKMMTQPKNTQAFIIGVLSTLVVVLVGWVGYDKLFKPNAQTTVAAQISESPVISEPVDATSAPDPTPTPAVEQVALKSQHAFNPRNGNLLQGSGNGEVYPELGFPDTLAPGFKKSTANELLSQIDAEYHEGLDMTEEPTAYGLKPMNNAPAQVKKLSTSIQSRLPSFVNQVFERPSVSDVVVTMQGWMSLGGEEYLYRALVTSARYQCTWYQVVIDRKTGKDIYEEYIPCYEPNQRDI